MIKKLYGLLVIFIGMFMFIGEVRAAEDNSLVYDIEVFNVTDDKITISGWAFIHNVDNYGYLPGETDGKYTESYTGRYYTDSTGTVDNDCSITINKEDAKLQVYFYFSDNSGNKLVGSDGKSDIYVTFVDSNFLKLMCYKSSGECYYYDTPNIYKNVRFTVTIDLNNFKSSMGNSEWNLKIGAKNANGNANSIESSETLAVDYSVANNTSDAFAISGLKKTVDVVGNHVTFSASDDINYWKLAKYYELVSREKNNEEGIYYYRLKYRKGATTGTVASGYNSACGFSYKSSLDGDGSGGIVNKTCTDKCSVGSCSNALIKSVFVKPSGSVKIKYINNDRYCSITDSSANSCDGSMSYTCNAMTVSAVKNGSTVKADVSVTESAKWEQGEFDSSGNFVSNKPFTKTIVAGKGFKYGIRYTDTVVIKLDTSSRNYSGSTYDSAILDEAVSNSVALTAGDFSVVDAISPWNYGDGAFSTAGQWNCTSSTITNGTKRTITQTCDYILKEAGIIYKSTDGYPAVTYFDSSVPSTHMNGGKYYYIPLNYSNNTFNWNFKFSNLGTYNFITSENGTKEPLGWTIDSSVNANNTCYVNVVKTNNTGDGSVCVGTGCGGITAYYLPVYRSINHLNPFPGYTIYPDNWEFYDSTHEYNRVKNSYNSSPVYQTIKEVKNANFGTSGYTTFDDITAPSGTADSIISNSYFDVINRKHCEWGVWNEGCDT